MPVTSLSTLARLRKTTFVSVGHMDMLMGRSVVRENTRKHNCGWLRHSRASNIWTAAGT